MKRPEIIVNVFSSIDGRITTYPGRNVTEWTALGLDGGAHRECHLLFDRLDCDGVISGSETIMIYGNHPVEVDDPIPQPEKAKAYIVFDGGGRADWAQTEGLMVVTRENVSTAYTKQLRDKQIDYIQAGKGEHIDLSIALEKLYDKGYRRLGLSAGGGINGAFLRGGFIDELSLIVAPVAVGGLTTPTLFDCPDLADVNELQSMQLLESKPVGEGAVWLYYKSEKS